MKKILVPTDFSDVAAKALRCAIHVAHKSNAEIILLNVMDFPGHLLDSSPYNQYVHSLNSFIDDLRKESKEGLKKLISNIKTDINIRTFSEAGIPKDLIVQYVEEHDIDMIVMGTNGASGLKEILVGSVTEKVLRHASCPVLTVHDWDENKGINHIVLALDTDEPKADYSHVKNFISIFDPRIDIVRINTPERFISTKLTHKRLKNFAERNGFKNYTITQYDHERFEEGLIEYATDKKADILAVGTHGRTGIAHLLQGSMTEELVNHADFPIFTFKLKK